MAVRASMSALITRTRLLINDPAGTSQQFADQDVQDVLDESRRDAFNLPLKGQVTYANATLQWLTHTAPYGNWESDFVLKQYLTVPVTAATVEVIPGIFTFAQNTYPTVYLSGKTYDLYRAAADLLERWAARWMLNHDFASDGQSFKPSQVPMMLQKLAQTYRLKQRAGVIVANRADFVPAGASGQPSLAAKPIDYMASG